MDNINKDEIFTREQLQAALAVLDEVKDPESVRFADGENLTFEGSPVQPEVQAAIVGCVRRTERRRRLRSLALLFPVTLLAAILVFFPPEIYRGGLKREITDELGLDPKLVSQNYFLYVEADWYRENYDSELDPYDFAAIRYNANFTNAVMEHFDADTDFVPEDTQEEYEAKMTARVNETTERLTAKRLPNKIAAYTVSAIGVIGYLWFILASFFFNFRAMEMRRKGLLVHPAVLLNVYTSGYRAGKWGNILVNENDQPVVYRGVHLGSKDNLALYALGIMVGSFPLTLARIKDSRSPKVYLYCTEILNDIMDEKRK